jgi:hypothetical protein
MRSSLDGMKPTPRTDAVIKHWTRPGHESSPEALQLYQLARQLERDNSMLREALEVSGHQCEHLHHRKDHRHGAGEPCPVERMIWWALNTVPKMTDE